MARLEAVKHVESKGEDLVEQATGNFVLRFFNQELFYNRCCYILEKVGELKTDTVAVTHTAEEKIAEAAHQVKGLIDEIKIVYFFSIHPSFVDKAAELSHKIEETATDFVHSVQGKIRIDSLQLANLRHYSNRLMNQFSFFQ